MTFKTFIRITILILWSSSLRAQFTTKELQSIRVSQLKALACDTLLISKDRTISIQSSQINNYKEAVTRYQLKDSIYLDEKHYYLDQIRERNQEITRLQRKQKLSKITLIGVAIGSGILFGYLMLTK
jgi:hypothetical protein